MLPDTTATEKSPVANRHEILRRPKSRCQLTDGIVGLLRMTATGKRKAVSLEMKDTSSAEKSMPTDRRNCWPFQNDGIYSDIAATLRYANSIESGIPFFISPPTSIGASSSKSDRHRLQKSESCSFRKESKSVF